MNINEFFNSYGAHPILFIGAGFSFRYLSEALTWRDLLKRACSDLTGNDDLFYDFQGKANKDGKIDFPYLGKLISDEFEKRLSADYIHKHFLSKEVASLIRKEYNNYSEHNIKVTKFKIYISLILNKMSLNEAKLEEVEAFKEALVKIGSIITTNYDDFTQSISGFNPLVGNDIILSNPYGSIYKIHGCVNSPSSIIITTDDYSEFEIKYELIRAQLLSLFIHHPIIFIGYSIGDSNIQKILSTIFSYVDPKSDLAKKIKRNFLLVSYKEGCFNLDVTEQLFYLGEKEVPIEINIVETDNYLDIYKAMKRIKTKCSVMDIRKVESVVKNIKDGGEIKVQIETNLDNIANSEMILAIGDSKNIQYLNYSSKNFVSDYFSIIDNCAESKINMLSKNDCKAQDYIKIQENVFFPACYFYSICQSDRLFSLVKQQKKKMKELGEFKTPSKYKDIDCLQLSQLIKHAENSVHSSEYKTLAKKALSGDVSLEDLEEFLRENKANQFDNADSNRKTNYRRLLCVYDYMKYRGRLGNIDKLHISLS